MTLPTQVMARFEQGIKCASQLCVRACIMAPPIPPWAVGRISIDPSIAGNASNASHAVLDDQRLAPPAANTCICQGMALAQVARCIRMHACVR